MKPLQNIFLGFALILLPFFCHAAPALAERNVGHPLHYEAYSSIIQWTSNNGAVINLRIYYITKDDRVIEGSRSSTSSQWVYNELPGIRAYHKSPIVAAVHQRSLASAGDVEIRLFYEEPEVSAWYQPNDNGASYGKRRMRSAYYKPETAWKVDDGFYNNIGYVATPGSAVSWVDKQGKVQWRLFFISQAPGEKFDPYALARMILTQGQEQIWRTISRNSIYEGCKDINTGSWKLCNGNQPIAVASQMVHDLGSVAAISWDTGSRISVFWWDAKDSGPTWHGAIRETRWRDGQGWRQEPEPHKSWSDNILGDGRLAAVTWLDGKGVEQIRLYASMKLRGGDANLKTSVFEYQADARGWVGGRTERMAWAERDFNGQRPISAVAWTGPNSREDAHIRVLVSSCASNAANCWSGTAPTALYQGEFDTGLGWRSGGRVSA